MKTLLKSYVTDRKRFDAVAIILLLALVGAGSSPLILVR
jgi:hypothetical protein